MARNTLITILSKFISQTVCNKWFLKEKTASSKFRTQAGLRHSTAHNTHTHTRTTSVYFCPRTPSVKGWLDLAPSGSAAHALIGTFSCLSDQDTGNTRFRTWLSSYMGREISDHTIGSEVLVSNLGTRLIYDF